MKCVECVKCEIWVERQPNQIRLSARILDRHGVRGVAAVNLGQRQARLEEAELCSMQSKIGSLALGAELGLGNQSPSPTGEM